MVSASDTTAMASAPAASGADVGPPDRRDGQRREALRQHPDQLTPRSASPKTLVAAIASTTIDEHGGHLRQPALQDQDQRRSPPRPTAAAAGTTAPSATPSTNPVTSPIRPSASTEKPNSFGSWPTRIVTASPFM